MALGNNYTHTLLYDMNTGVPVSVPFDVAQTGVGGIVWTSATEFYLLATTMISYAIVGGVATKQGTIGYSTHNFAYNVQRMKFMSGHALATSQSAPYFSASVRLFDPDTHFPVRDYISNNNDSGTSSGSPTAYVKGE